jgi:hypothetical protein
MAQDMLKSDAHATDELVEMRRAQAHYARLRDRLEAEAPDQYATVDVEDGRYTISPVRFGAGAVFKAKYGDRPAWTFHIGTA